MADVTFVGDLPGAARHGGGRTEPRYEELCRRPGQWAEWWGATNSVHKAVRTIARPGFYFEAAVRNGVAYIRAMPVVEA